MKPQVKPGLLEVLIRIDTIVNIKILVGGGFCFVFIFISQYNHSHLLDCSISNVSLNTLLRVHIFSFMGLLRTFMKCDGMGWDRIE